MATTVHDIHNIIDEMYNARSEFRSVYSKLTSGNSYTLETKLVKAITKATGTNKCGIEIDIPLFTINIIFESEEIASKLKKNVENGIDGVLRSFLETEFSSCPAIKSYLENPANKLIDIYTVGESIKILM